MDEIDRAQQENERHLERSILKINTKRQVAATGYCLNCDEALQETQRWCNEDCRDDWQRRINFRRGK